MIFNAYYSDEYYGEISAPSCEQAEHLFLNTLIELNPTTHPELLMAFMQINTIK